MPETQMQVDEDSAARGSRPSAGEILRSIAFAAMGFCATAGLLHAAIRNPLTLHADVRSEKLAMLAQWHGKLFSAAFGSSHMHNGFDPSAFDRAMSQSAYPTQTGNLAIVGGSQVEQYVMASQFLRQLEPPAQAAAPAQPCLILLELGAGTNFTNDHLVHPRAINLYDWPATKLATHFAGLDSNAGRHPGRAGYAFAAMFLHDINLGMLSNKIFSPPLSDEIMRQQTEDDRRGQMVLGDNPVTLPYIVAALKRMPEHPAIHPETLSPGSSYLIRQLAAQSPLANVAFVYVVMPLTANKAESPDYPDHLSVDGPHGRLDVPILNLARADRFPQLFVPTLWFDDSHLNAAGSQLMSTLLAHELQRWYAAHGGPPPCQ
jgi:hypothetical protein